MSARLAAGVERAAAKASRERPVRLVRPGWWVYSYGPVGGGWGQVVGIEWLPQGRVRVRLCHLDGRAGVVEVERSASMSYLTEAAARRVGIAGGGR